MVEPFLWNFPFGTLHLKFDIKWEKHFSISLLTSTFSPFDQSTCIVTFDNNTTSSECFVLGKIQFSLNIPLPSPPIRFVFSSPLHSPPLCITSTSVCTLLVFSFNFLICRTWQPTLEKDFFLFQLSTSTRRVSLSFVRFEQSILTFWMMNVNLVPSYSKANDVVPSINQTQHIIRKSYWFLWPRW